MKKNIFKFGAALTAAMMVFSATASLAFADEAETEVQEPETVVSDVVADPEAEAVEEEVVEEVVIPLETEEITAADLTEEADETAEAAAAVADVPTNSKVKIDTVTATFDDSYYTVNVHFTVTDVPSQMSFFVYDITKITGDQNNNVGFKTETETPIGYINQYAGLAESTYTFKLKKGTGEKEYNENSIIVAKIGGTDVETPDAASYSLANAIQGGGDDVTLGDVNGDGEVNSGDALLIMKRKAGKLDTDFTEAQVKAADVNGDNDVNSGDALLIMKRKAGKIDKFPIE